MSSVQQIQNFICIVDKQGISAAAIEQSISPAAASKRLQALEDQLGVRLLTRNTRSVALTEAGHYYYSHQQRIMHEMTRIDDYVKAMRGTIKGQLKINLPMSYGKYRINPMIVSFLKKHPEIEIHCDYDDAFVDVNSGDYDIVIRVGELVDSDVVARKLEPMKAIIVVSPLYLKQHDLPCQPKDLSQHNCLLYSNLKYRDIWSFEDKNNQQLAVKVKGNFSSNNGESLLQAAVEGLGISIVPQFLLRGELENGQLISLLDDYHLSCRNAYALFPSRQYLPEKIRVFIDYLVKQMTLN